MTDRGSNRQAQPTASGSVWVVAGGLGLVVLSLIVVYSSAHLGRRLAGLDGTPRNLGETLRGLVVGELEWPPVATTVAIAHAGAVLLLAIVIGVWRYRRRRRRTRIDWTAEVLGRGREIEGISERSAKKKADKLGVQADSPGLTLGRTVAPPRAKVYASWEDTIILAAGTRVGKSTSYVIPAILEAPGAAFVTSNKRDLADATRDVRGAAGSRPWVFDPQRVVGDGPVFWWDPLSHIRAAVDNNEADVKAREMAQHFSSNAAADGARIDAFFEPKGTALLGNFLLAAAVAELPITNVYRWITREDDKTPAKILESHGYSMQAEGVLSTIASPEKQRGGVYGTAEKMSDCLTVRAMEPWITDDFGRRPHFDPAAFVDNGETLYSLSKEGAGSSGAIVTALTNAIADVAEEKATKQSLGRLATPLVGLLDEACNVCRWRELPKKYSHYGSRGILLQTVIQSWSQAVGVWGEDGAKQLWSASNIRIYAGGIGETDFLRMLSELVGTYDKTSRSVSTRGSGSILFSGAQVSSQLQRESIMEIADLAAWPRGRALVMSSGNRATLLETLPWMTGSHADAVKASIRAHDPGADETLSRAAQSLATVQAELAHHAVSPTQTGAR